MKWRIRKDPRMPSVPWRVTGWTWAAEHGEWVRVHSWQPTFEDAVTAMDRFSRRYLTPGEAPC